MSPPSPPTRRTLEIVTALACSSDGAGMTMSELCSHTGTSRSTARAVIEELVAAQWVERTSSGHYLIGQALIKLGARISVPLDLARVARPAMEHLAVETGMSASVTELRDGALEVLSAVPARGRAPSPVGLPVGFISPFKAPFGREYAAFLSTAKQKAWTEAGNVSPTTQLRMDEIVKQIYKRGWSLERMTPERRELVSIASVLESAGVRPLIRNRISELFTDLATVDLLKAEAKSPTLIPVFSISAPVFGPDRFPIGAIAVTPVRQMTTRSIDRIADEVTLCANSVTQTLIRTLQPASFQDGKSSHKLTQEPAGTA